MASSHLINLLGPLSLPLNVVIMSLASYSSDERSAIIITTAPSCCKWTACAWLPTTDLIRERNRLFSVFSQPGSAEEGPLFPTRMINGL